MLQKLEVAWQYWEILKTVTQLNDLIPSDVCELPSILLTTGEQ